MNIKFVRIAELTENIEKLNSMIELHEKTTQNKPTIIQYKIKRMEFISELQQLLNSIKLSVSFQEMAIAS